MLPAGAHRALKVRYIKVQHALKRPPYSVVFLIPSCDASCQVQIQKTDQNASYEMLASVLLACVKVLNNKQDAV